MIVRSGGENFYGTREAYFFLNLNGRNIRRFANDLQSAVAKANLGTEEYNQLYLDSGEDQMIIGAEHNKEETSSLVKAFRNTPVISLTKNRQGWPRFKIADFISIPDKQTVYPDRLLRIFSIPAPNDVITFDPSFIYDLGWNYGELVRGEDYDDVPIKNYSKVKRAFRI